MTQQKTLSDIVNFKNAIAQCVELEMEIVHATKQQVVTMMPYDAKLIGDPESGVVHGGCITTLMDSTCGFMAFSCLPEFEACPTLDLRMEYLRAARPDQPIYARAYCYHTTANILFLRCEAYQEEEQIAYCTASFMRMGQKVNLSIADLQAAYNPPPPLQNIAPDSLPSSFNEAVGAVLAQHNYGDLLKYIPYAQYIGVTVENSADELVFKLEKRANNLGNPILPAIHGGVIGGFMELAGALHLMFIQTAPTFPRIINFSLDYVRAGQFKESYASCTVTRQGNRIANVEIRAWQDSPDKPIALGRAHFLL